MKRFSRGLGVLVLAAMVMAGATLPALAMTGQDVIDRVKDEYGNFNSQVVNMKIKTYDGKTLVTDREVVVLTRSHGEVEQSLLKFLSPKDVEGVGLLDLGDDLMYLYLPEFGKVRRIAGSAKSGSFMGTDFTYSDLSFINYDTSDYVANLIDETAESYELELRTNDQDVAYEKVLMTVRKSDWFPTKVVFFNKEGKRQKELSAFDVTEYGKYKFPKRLEMVDIIADHSTIILLDEPEFDRELSDDLFTTRTLQRTRIRY